MNSDFENLASEISEALRWDTGPTVDALRAYSHFKETKMPILPSKSNADVILAGVQSCHLALATLDALDGETQPWAQAMVSAARKTLDHWGLEVKPIPKPAREDPEPVSDPSPFAPDLSEMPKAAPPVEPNALVWPPPEPTLPAIYTENFYIVRDLPLTSPLMKAKLEAGDPLQPLTEVAIGVGTQLSFLGTARWSSENECWLMRMHWSITLAMGNNLWVFSKALKPGDEIPKVIDGATLAGNNDP